MNEGAALSPKWSVVLVAGLTLLAALMATFSQMDRYPNADTLLPAVMSTQKVTWYFWGQNRLGSLLPLLASPVRDIHTNFFVQQFLKAVFAALSPVFLVQMLRPSVTAPAAHAAALLGLFGAAQPFLVNQFWLESQPYATSITLVGVAMLVNDRSRLPFWPRSLAVFALVLVGTWVNIAIVLVTAPAFFLFLLVERGWRHAGMLTCSVLCYALVSYHAKFFPNPPAYTSFKFSLANLEALVKTTRHSLVDSAVPALLVGLAAVIAVAIWVAPAVRPMVRRTLVLVLGCLATMLITGCLSWFSLNDYSTRYLCLPLSLIFGATAIAVVEAVAALVRPAPGVRVLGTLAICAVALAATSRVMKPSLEVPLIKPAYADLADRAVKERAVFVAGDYWPVWPAVFEMLRRIAPSQVYGLTHRGEDMRFQINAAAVDGATIVCADADENVCRRVFHDAANRNEIRGRPLDEALKVVDRGSYGPDNKPLTVLRIDAP